MSPKEFIWTALRSAKAVFVKPCGHEWELLPVYLVHGNSTSTPLVAYRCSKCGRKKVGA